MKDTEVFAKLIGIEKPWKVKEVRLDVAGQKVEVELACEEGVEWWDEEGQRARVHGYEERRWRHLDTMQCVTEIVARVPRVRYEDGRTELVKVPWAQKHSRWTLAFEAIAITVLAAAGSVQAAAGWLRLSWKAAHEIMRRAVERGLIRRDLAGVESIGLDEKSFGRGQDYITVMSEPNEKRVLDVVAGRSKEDTCKLLETLILKVREKIKSVSMDMSSSYKAAVEEKLPKAQIVYDRFHISAQLGEAVDEVRKEEHRRLMEQGDDRLSGSKYIWLQNYENMTEARRKRFEELSQLNTKTSEAMYYRLQFKEFWEQVDAEEGEIFFTQWEEEALKSGLKAIEKVAQTLRRHLYGLLNWFAYRISNGPAEGINSRIQTLKSNARGFRSFANYRTRILFFLGKLNLNPAQ